MQLHKLVKMDENTVKRYVQNVFLYKTNEKMHRKPGMKCFLHSLVWCYFHWIQNFVTLLLREIWSKHLKLCTKLSLLKINKIMT